MLDRFGPHFRNGRRSRREKRRQRLWKWAALVLLAVAAGSWWLSDYRPRAPTDPAPAAAETGMDGAPAGPGIVVNLPADDAPHRNAMEWWYYNSHLRAGDGRKFSFHYVYFLVNSVMSYTVSHISLIDHQTGKRYTEQKESAGNPSAGSMDGFDFVLGDWSMTGSGGKDRLKVAAPKFAFDLTLSNPGPTVFQGGTGLLDFKQAGSSYYYSRPRMSLQGTLKLGGASFPVTGQSWFDHQWGDFRPGILGWDWFALNLDDGADVMLYRLRDQANQPVLYSGTYSLNRQSWVLNEGDFSAEALGSWRSKATGITYQTSWRVKIPSRHIDLEISPVAADSEIDARTTTYNAYWEGPVKLSGSHSGQGFLEISPAGSKKTDAPASSETKRKSPSSRQ